MKIVAPGTAACQSTAKGTLAVVMANLSFEEFSSRHRARLRELYHYSDAERWTVCFREFAQACWQGACASPGGDDAEIAAHLRALRTTDLALALGCLGRDERAWDTFCAQYRPLLYEAARSLTHQETQARDLVDSLLAELYGAEPGADERRSRLAYFHGRSSLKTWLRSVLYQKFVDEYRRQSRLQPLKEDIREPAATGAVSEADEHRYAELLGDAVKDALITLPPPDKLLLSYYYVQGLTLKQIGRLTAEHEATISRHLERLRGKLRQRIEGYLRKTRKLSAHELDCCLNFAARGAPVELERILKPQ